MFKLKLKPKTSKKVICKFVSEVLAGWFVVQIGERYDSLTKVFLEKTRLHWFCKQVYKGGGHTDIGWSTELNCKIASPFVNFNGFRTVNNLFIVSQLQ